MFSLSWDVEELKTIYSQGYEIQADVLACSQFCCPELFQSSNVATTTIRTRLLEFTKRVEHFKGTPATHIFVLMLSSELCNKKPYVVPVQCIPYAGLKEIDLVSALCKEMSHHGMKVAGMYIEYHHE